MCLIFTIISSNNWEVNSLDNQSAFLQGKSITRDVYLMPPKEAGPEKLWKLKKCVYGLTDASRHWYLRVAEELSKLGVHKCIYDEALFYWYFGNVCMVSFVHTWMISSGEDLPDSNFCH